MSAAKRQRELNRAKKEHENAKLSAQIATGNVVLTNIAESVMAKLIERQAAQINHLQMALADTEALEAETSARCLKQAAQIEMMREALIACRDDLELRMKLSEDDSLNISNSVLDKMLDAIDITPDQALEQFAERVRKQCIGVCYEVGPKEYPNKLITDGYADAIRAIKDLP